MSRRPHRLLLLALIVLLAPIAACYQRSEKLPRVVEPDERPVIRLGVVPSRTPRDEILRYGPLADLLSEATSRRVLVRPAATTSILLNRLATGRVDLAVLGPAAFLRARKAIGVEALARELVLGRPTYRAALVVREECPARSIVDLADRILALVEPESTTGQLLPLAGLRDAGLDPSELRAVRYEDRQEEVIRAIQMREVDAGAVREETAERHVGRGLRILWRSAPVPGPVLVARSGLDPGIRDALRDALLATRSGSHASRRPVPATEIPRYAPVLPATTAQVEALMLRIYGVDAFSGDLRLTEAATR